MTYNVKSVFMNFTEQNLKCFHKINSPLTKPNPKMLSKVLLISVNLSQFVLNTKNGLKLIY